MSYEYALAPWQPRLLSVLRIITGLMLFQFGVAKILKFPPNTPFAKVEVFSLVGYAGLIELFLGALLIVGLFTRPVAFILAGEMAFAYFIGHFPTSFYPVINGGTPAILLCFTCLYLASAGPGPWSVDARARRA